MPRVRGVVSVLASVAGVAVIAAGALAPAAQGAPAADPAVWVVSLGDSYISGEAGRWAGNETGGTRHMDALGTKAYWDTPTGEAITNCHRSQSAVIHIGVVKSLNLACSGATTASSMSGADWKPGIDFFARGSREGQALLLERFARGHDVRMVALSIGGNDFDFGPIVASCVKAFVLRQALCQNDPGVRAKVDPQAQARITQDITGAILNVAKAMESAGRTYADWTLVLQLYPQPIPPADEFRYGEGIFGGRQTIGGCGFWGADANWAVDALLPTVNAAVTAAGRAAVTVEPGLQIRYLDTTVAYDRRELCQREVNRVGAGGGVRDWTSADAADRSEWVMDINVLTTDARQQQESLHPNYWGQLALRDCWRDVWNDGEVIGGRCIRVGGLNGRGEPRMRLGGNPAKFVLG